MKKQNRKNCNFRTVEENLEFRLARPARWATHPICNFIAAPCFIHRHCRWCWVRSLLAIMHTTVSTLSFQHATRLLRCQRTGRYFTGAGWSPNQSDAKPYHADIDVAEACVS